MLVWHTESDLIDETLSSASGALLPKIMLTGLLTLGVANILVIAYSLRSIAQNRPQTTLNEPRDSG